MSSFICHKIIIRGVGEEEWGSEVLCDFYCSLFELVTLMKEEESSRQGG
jgi:hypothetical protein